MYQKPKEIGVDGGRDWASLRWYKSIPFVLLLLNNPYRYRGIVILVGITRLVIVPY